MYCKLICILYALLCGQNFILVKSGCYRRRRRRRRREGEEEKEKKKEEKEKKKDRWIDKWVI
jgi:hypothetical protein